MELHLKKTLLNNLFLKIYAFLVGCSIWYSLSALYPINYTLKIPVRLHGNMDELQVIAPQYIDITIEGYKQDLYTLERMNLAFHVNCDTLAWGQNTIPTTHKNLFLPRHYKLLHCNPADIIITKTIGNNI